MGNKNCLKNHDTQESEIVQFSQSNKLKQFKQVDLRRYFNFLNESEINTLDNQLVHLNLHDLDSVSSKG